MDCFRPLGSLPRFSTASNADRVAHVARSTLSVAWPWRCVGPRNTTVDTHPHLEHGSDVEVSRKSQTTIVGR